MLPESIMLKKKKMFPVCVCVWPCLWYHFSSYKEDAGRWRQRHTVAIVSRFSLSNADKVKYSNQFLSACIEVPLIWMPMVFVLSALPRLSSF